MKIGKSRSGVLVAAGGALVALVAPSAWAGSVTINPSAGSLRMGTDSVLAASAAVSLVAHRGDATFDQVESGSLVRDFSSSAVSGSGSGQARWRFSLSYVAGSGYALDFTPVLTGFTRVGDGAAIESVSVARSGMIAEDGDVPAGSNGRAAAKGSFNFLRLRAASVDASESLSFDALTFDSGLTSVGSLTSGVIDGSGIGRSSIDGSAARGSFFQDIVSDTDLSQHDWLLTGLLTTSGAAFSGIAFDVDLFDSSFQTLQVVPLPSGAGLAIAGVLVAGLRRRR